jgi:hypothetical protein
VAAVEPIRVSNKTAVSNFLPWIRIAREEMPAGCCFVLIFNLLPLLIGSSARSVRSDLTFFFLSE